MAKPRRLLLDNKLRAILGSSNVYFRAPESVKMKYPAFTYKMSGVDDKRADNLNYIKTVEYEIVHICKDPDNDIYETMFENFDKVRFVRRFTKDNLIHDVFYLYW